MKCEQLSNYVLLITLAPTKMKYTWRRIKDVQCNILYEVFEFEECLHICNTGYINVRRGCISWQWLSMCIYFQIGRLFCFILPGSDYCIMFHHVIACCVILFPFNSTDIWLWLGAFACVARPNNLTSEKYCLIG